MRTLILALSAVALAAGCATADPPRSAIRGGHASPDGAAFMGYHGPVWRQAAPAHQVP